MPLVNRFLLLAAQNRRAIFSFISVCSTLVAAVSGVISQHVPTTKPTTSSAGKKADSKSVTILPNGMDADDPNALAPPPPVGPAGPTQTIPGSNSLKLPKINASSAILLDADTGQVVYEKDADAERPMASTTKIMTALLLCENVPETTVITASPNACKIHNCSLHLKLGEQLTAHDLLRAMLIRSANDTCVAAAEQVAGSESAFVSKMNSRAKELGALRTHFANPHGLTAPDHYTTARDLATIARTVVKQQRIMDVVKLLDCTIDRSIKKTDCNLHNYSHFVGRYSGAEGLKSGWTTPSGHCYVGVASHKGWRLISVVLKSNEYGSDTSALMNYGFNNFERIRVSDPGAEAGAAPVTFGVAPTVPAVSNGNLTVIVRKGDSDHIETRARYVAIKAPVAAGSIVGSLEARIAGKSLNSVPIVAIASVAEAPRISVLSGSGGTKMMYGLALFMVGLVSLRYGSRKRKRISPFAKSSRGRGARFTANLRDDNFRR